MPTSKCQNGWIRIEKDQKGFLLGKWRDRKGSRRAATMQKCENGSKRSRRDCGLNEKLYEHLSLLILFVSVQPFVNVHDDDDG